MASERAILAHASLAVSAGAEIHGREKVVAIEPANGRVVVVTDRDRYEAGTVVVSTGGWISDLIPSLKTKAVPERQVLGWFLPQKARPFPARGLPGF